MQSAEFLENLETKNIVLIHGEGFGAWCWYKNISLLEETGMIPTALDLTGSGIDLKDTNNVILVGHSSGGACVSYAMEQFPQKFSKAVFLAVLWYLMDKSPLMCLRNRDGKMGGSVLGDGFGLKRVIFFDTC
ncbi:putative alpha/Beta hydrolase [Helianthus annuus]|nr:putative alpha/Beta hydrolase [Helianthus annuus]